MELPVVISWHKVTVLHHVDELQDSLAIDSQQGTPASEAHWLPPKAPRQLAWASPSELEAWAPANAYHQDNESFQKELLKARECSKVYRLSLCVSVCVRHL
jgi:hypothetical protein